MAAAETALLYSSPGASLAHREVAYDHGSSSYVPLYSFAKSSFIHYMGHRKEKTARQVQTAKLFLYLNY